LRCQAMEIEWPSETVKQAILLGLPAMLIMLPAPADVDARA